MIKPYKSPALGWILVYDEATPPGFGAKDMPAFHVNELKLLAKASEAEWRDVAVAKLVFPGAVVTERVRSPVENRKRVERRLKRPRFDFPRGGGLKHHEPSQDDD